MTTTSTNNFKRAARISTVLFFFFMLLHQTDKLIIGPLQTQVMETFKMTYTQWGAINTGALLVGAILYPVWGWLNDHYNRGKLLALASLIWGSTTWLSAIVKTFPGFLVTRSSTGIDDSSYPGMMSLLADYYPPKSRGKVYGILQLTQPIGYLLGMVLALILGGMLGWRSIFYITGSLGVVLAIAIYFGVKDVPRGSSEEELKGVEVGKYKFSWKTAVEIFKKRSLWFVFAQGFIGVFPWNVITYYFFGYLATDRGYDSNTQLMIMAPAVLFMAAGYPLGGIIGDRLFKKNKRGRLIAGATGILLGAVLLYFTINTPNAQVALFSVLLFGTALFMPFASPNIISTIYDVTLPEVRSTANAIQNFIEFIGSAAAPLIAGIIADKFSVGTAILSICLTAWAFCFIFILIAIVLIPKDINAMHRQLQERAAAEKTA
ncbi:MAG TPA: MFS transporter [Anaerolineaceae bacterium]|nr:MFS transporter [Anaerolineaceae bacterium]